MQINIATKDGNVTIQLQGRFDFNTHRDFRACIEEALKNKLSRKILVDLGAVDYLDSSALGMLLILRDKAQEAGKTVELTNCRGSVAQILQIANFGDLFPIS
jgi:anti-anti-sigma factor